MQHKKKSIVTLILGRRETKKINYIKDEEFHNFLSENYEDIYNNMVKMIGKR